MLAGLTLGLAGCSASTAAPLVSPPASPVPPEPSDPPASTPTASATPHPGWTARVMTYNMLTPNLGGAHFRAAVKDSDVRLSNRVPVMARWIRGANPDIVGLQENEANPPRRLPVGVLAPLLPAYEVIHPRLNVPLLVRKKAFDVLADGSLDITQGHLPRHVGWCRLRHLRSGHVVLVANTHLDPFQKAYKASERAAEAREIVALLEKLNPGGTLPTILLGDLNVRATETRDKFAAPLVSFAGAGLRDSATLAAEDISKVPGAASLNSFGAEVGGRWTYRAIRTDGYRYDYIFVSPGIDVRTWQVVTGPGVRMIDGHPFFADGPVPSDHCPVQAELLFPDA